jgi:hypothetical protein
LFVQDDVELQGVNVPSQGQTFVLDIKRFIEKTGLNVNTVIKKIFFDLSASIVSLSPVDTGRFRANWQYGLGSVPDGTVEDKDADGPVGATTISRIMGQVDPKPAGKVLYLVNNLPYAVPLEYGWSKQAPAGMVRISVQRYQDFVANAIRDLP